MSTIVLAHKIRRPLYGAIINTQPLLFGGRICSPSRQLLGTPTLGLCNHQYLSFKFQQIKALQFSDNKSLNLPSLIVSVVYIFVKQVQQI
jgi:hypothetical protein